MRTARLRYRSWPMVLALACGVAAMLLLPASAQPVRPAPGGASAQGTFTVTKSGPATAYVGERISFAIAITRSGPPPTAPEQVRFTDQLPPQLTGPGMGAVQGAITDCTFAGQEVSCTATFAPQSPSTITLSISATVIAEGAATNTISLSTGATASWTTTITQPPPPPRGSFVVSKTGPETVSMAPGRRAPPFDYTITIRYVGPPRSGFIPTRFIERFPVALTSPSFPASDGAGVSDCSHEYGPTQPDGAPGAITLSCAISIDATRPASFTLRVRPYPTRPGIQTNVFELANGDSGSWTTNFVREASPPPPPEPPEPPPPIPGPPAAPTRTVTETFTRPGEVEPQSAPIAPTAKTAQIALTWPAGSSFDVTGIQLVPREAGRTLAGADRVRPRRLKISKRRTSRSLDVRIGRLKPGRLRFRIVARRVDGRTRVTARIRQSRRG